MARRARMHSRPSVVSVPWKKVEARKLWKIAVCACASLDASCTWTFTSYRNRICVRCHAKRLPPPEIPKHASNHPVTILSHHVKEGRKEGVTDRLTPSLR